MAKIIDIKRDLVTIELDDKSTKIFKKEDLLCTLRIGQEVDVFTNGEVTIVKDSSSYSEPDKSSDNYTNHFKTYSFNFIPHARIKKWKYLLLCLVGFTGIQRIMTNRLFSGIFCLICLLSGVLSFISIITWAYDLVIALLRPSDSEGYIYI